MTMVEDHIPSRFDQRVVWCVNSVASSDKTANICVALATPTIQQSSPIGMLVLGFCAEIVIVLLHLC